MHELPAFPAVLSECAPGDVVELDNGDVVRVTSMIVGTPMGRKKVEAGFGWGELECMDGKAKVVRVVQWAR